MKETIISAIIVIIGAVLLFAGLAGFGAHLELITTGIPGHAKVLRSYRVENASSRGGNRSFSYYAVLEYTATDGQMYRPTVSIGGVLRKPVYQAEQVVSILYPRATPGQPQINAILDLWLLPLLATIFGSGAIALVVRGHLRSRSAN